MAAGSLCKIEGCGKPAKGRGWCTMHWRRWRVNGDPLVARVYTEGVTACTVCGATEGRIERGLCSAHLHRLKRHGDPLKGGKARPAKGEPLQYLLAHMRDGCSYPWPFATAGTPRHYPQVKIDGKKVLGHRHVCELANGPPPTPDHEAAHACNNPSCFNADCLRWATTVENNADKLFHDTHNRGERHSMAKLTEADVRFIRSTNATAETLSARFGVSVSHISNVRTGKSWGWLNTKKSGALAC